MKIVFVINRLDRAGAETQMVLLSQKLNELGHKTKIISIGGIGELDTSAREKSVEVVVNAPTRRIPGYSLFFYLREIKKFQPDVIYPFLPRQHLKVTLIKILTKPSLIVWGIRASEIDWSKYKLRSRFIFPMVTKLSIFADHCIANSTVGAEYHIGLGYRSKRMSVVENGLDTTSFKPDILKRRAIRISYGINETTKVIGMLARFDPLKRNSDLIKVGSLVCQSIPNVHLFAVGRHTPEHLESLQSEAREFGIEDKLSVSRETDDPASFLNSFDVLLIPSESEGFPNVAVESLSCGTPVVTTDVGDALLIVDELDRKISPGDVQSLAEEVTKILKKPWNFEDRIQLSERTHQRFDARHAALRTEEILRNLLHNKLKQTKS